MNRVFNATIDKAIDYENKKGRLVFKGTEKDYEIAVLALSEDDPFTTNEYDVESVVLFLKDNNSNKIGDIPFMVYSKATGKLTGPFPYSREGNIHPNENFSISSINKIIEALRFEEEIDYVSFLNRVRGFILALDKEEYIDNIKNPYDSSIEEYILSSMYNIIRKKSFNLNIFLNKDLLINDTTYEEYEEKVSKYRDINLSIEMEVDKVIITLNKDKDIIMKNTYPINRVETDIVLPIKEIAIDIRKNLLLFIPYEDLRISHPNMTQGLLKSEIQFEIEVIAALNAYLIYRKRQLEGTFWDFGMKQIFNKEIPEGYIK